MATRRRTGRRTSPLGQQVPEACITRLSLYVRELALLSRKEATFVSSQWLAEHLGLSDAQVRRDLSYFGQFGISGRGYEVRRLHEQLTRILGVSGRTWNVALAGVGNLGAALLAHGGFRERGFLFRVAVDSDPKKVGQTVQGLTVGRAEDLPALAQQHRVHMGVIAVPAAAAQHACTQLVQGGVQAILNFAPIRLEVPASVKTRTVDLTVEMEGLAFHLASASRNGVPHERATRA